MNISTLKIGVATLVMTVAFGALAFDETGRQAMQAMTDDIVAELKGVGALDGKTIAALPIAGDQNDAFGGLLRIAVTKAGKQCVTSKDDPLFGEILREVAWNADKTDMLDASTVGKFGKLKSAQIILSGRIRVVGDNRQAFVEAELHATDIKTKQHVWGGRFAQRYYLPGSSPVKGVSEIPVEVRKVLQDKLTARIVESIGAQSKLKGFKTVAFLPLAGDVDGYVANIVRDAVVKTALTPKNLDIRTLAEARIALRDQKLAADGLLYGAVRDISFVGYEAGSKSGTTINVEIQACIEKAGTNEQAWSDTILVSESVESQLTGAEGFLADHPSVPKAVMILLGVLVLLFVIGRFVKATTRVR